MENELFEWSAQSLSTEKEIKKDSLKLRESSETLEIPIT